MNILDKIIANKKLEVEAAKKVVTIEELKLLPNFKKEVPSFVKNILADDSNGIIAEFKRKSPSKGDIHAGAKVEDIVPLYEKAGVSGVSILTDEHFFGGKNSDVERGRELISTPILRKEFIVDSYQIYEAKAMGASAILLIGAVLTKEETYEFAKLASDLGMEILFEAHDEVELDLINDYIQMVGINNRNLKTFEVDLEQSIKLANQLPTSMVPVAESGISSPEDYIYLKKAGFKAFLMGEYFMKNENPGEVCIEFANKIKEL